MLGDNNDWGHAFYKGVEKKANAQRQHAELKNQEERIFGSCFNAADGTQKEREIAARANPAYKEAQVATLQAAFDLEMAKGYVFAMEKQFEAWRTRQADNRSERYLT